MLADLVSLGRLKGHFHVDPDGSLRVHVDRLRLQPIGRMSLRIRPTP